jgi:1-deoxy-D-xylulose-5-phosphate reductoisomerase
MPAVLNGADEEVVKMFLEQKLEFTEISSVIYRVMQKHRSKKGNIKDYIEAENWARDYARRLVC